MKVAVLASTEIFRKNKILFKKLLIFLDIDHKTNTKQCSKAYSTAQTRRSSFCHLQLDVEDGQTRDKNDQKLQRTA